MGMSEQNQPEKKKNFQHHMAVPGKKGIIYTIARGIFWIYFHLFCFMHCTGREKLNLEAPYIVIANHTSFADPIIAAMLIRRYEVNFLGKIELAKAPVVGKLLMNLHMIPPQRHGGDARLSAGDEGGRRAGHFPRRHAPQRGNYGAR